MKFANYAYKAKRDVNIGDYMQILAVDNLYTLMGVKKEDIIYIDTEELSIYDGDYVILPISLLMHNISGDYIKDNFSKKIIPVFICYTTYLTKLQPEDVFYLSKYEPIGCRDLHTAMLLREYGIRAYVNGCITALFPKRKRERTALSTIFVVDVSDELLMKMPKHIKDNAEYISHLVPPTKADMKKYTMDIINKYKEEASLVITSRLHCAVPCMAMGIPVILVCDKYSSRLTWIDKVIPVYTLENYSKIDWDPKPVEFEDIKKLILSTVKNRLQNQFDKYNDIYTISDYYEDYKRPEYGIEGITRAVNEISKKWGPNDSFSYSIWGLTTLAQNLYDHISERFPNAKLENVYDKYRRIPFHGLTAKDPDMIGPDDNDFLFVALTASRTDGVEYLNKIFRPENTYIFLCNPLNNPLDKDNW